MATKKFKCNVCGYIHEGDAAPANCPVCGVPASEFTELKQEKKGLFSDKNGNAYIIMYSTVMVVVVAVLLAVAALALKPRQDANDLNEKKQNILASLSALDKSYDEYIDAYVVDKEGKRIEGEEVFALLNDLPQPLELGDVHIAHAAAAGAKQMVVLAQCAVKMVAALRNANLANGAALGQTAQVAVDGAQADVRTVTAHLLIHCLSRWVLTALHHSAIDKLALPRILAGKNRLTAV